MKGFTKKQRDFINEYLSDFNATQAARRAGYNGDDNSLAVIGHNLLRNIKIAQAIKTRIGECAMSSDEVLMRIAAQARSSMADFVTIDGDGAVSLDMEKAKKANALDHIKKITVTERLIKVIGDDDDSDAPVGKLIDRRIQVELYDAQAALKLLATHHQLLNQKLTIEVDWKQEIVMLLRDGALTPEDVSEELGSDLARELFNAAGINAV